MKKESTLNENRIKQMNINHEKNRLRSESDYIEEHKLYYTIYYNELTLFYQKTTIFTTIQLGLFSGVILKYDEISKIPGMMLICLFFLVSFSAIQLLVSIRGYNVNNAVIETISKFEKDNNFEFLSQFNTNVEKGIRISKMNYPSLMIVGVNILFLVVWIMILTNFCKNLFPDSTIFQLDIAEQTSNVKVVIISALYAVTMKIADLLDEHGLYLFKGADNLFGILWGILGAVLVTEDLLIANIIMAMMMGFVIRKRLDYINHIIAFIIITSSFFMFSKLVVEVYFPFLIAIVILGGIKDLKYNKTKSKIQLLVEKIYLYVPLVYALPTFIYCSFQGSWIIFYTFFIYDLVYNIIRIVVKKRKWYKD